MDLNRSFCKTLYSKFKELQGQLGEWKKKANYTSNLIESCLGCS